MRQKVGEIQAYQSYEKGSVKWCKEHIPQDKDNRGNEATLHGVIHESRKREGINELEDGSFMPHQQGPITSTFTGDWFLREGEGRELLGEWMKLTSVRSQDQRRMLQANSHTFPTNAWIHKITRKNKA
jgi:hypothetical protein